MTHSRFIWYTRCSIFIAPEIIATLLSFSVVFYFATAHAERSRRYDTVLGSAAVAKAERRWLLPYPRDLRYSQVAALSSVPFTLQTYPLAQPEYRGMDYQGSSQSSEPSAVTGLSTPKHVTWHSTRLTTWPCPVGY